ncbi:MAG TPA: aminotransferase class IV [Pyrinomonadaceae bacterium]|nr:aminotransferase class IV [Pyrinomonadaceae bacterium]
MNNHVSFNFHILPAEKTFITAVSSAALYGKGIFTTLAVYNSKPFLWEKHWRRLCENSAKIGIDLSSFEEKIVKHALSDLVLLNNLKTGRARLTFFDESPGKIWNFAFENKPSLFITTAEFQNAKDNFLLTVSPFPVSSKSPLAGVKSCNYLENLLALEEAQKRGFDEAIRLNEKDEIVSASMANIFWVKNEEIFTPGLETGCLAGTTRAFLLENFPVAETNSKINELSKANEIFLTSAGIGIRPASFGNGMKKNFPTFAKMTKLLDLYRVKS